LTQDEESLGVPLQVLCLAIFDAIMIYMMNSLSPDNTWQIVKRKICDRLYRGKHDRTVEILATHYADVDILCLQECAAIFQDRYRGSPLSESHELVSPAGMDGKRDQNSFVLLKKVNFKPESIREVTSFLPHLTRRQGSIAQEALQIAPGDLLVVEATHAVTNKKFLITSFHGDTSGKLTLPVVRALNELKIGNEQFKDHVYILGLDANVYEKGSDVRTPFDEFVRDYEAMGFISCFGKNPNVKLSKTTCSARTFLQPQLNKAVAFTDRIAKIDNNPKDTILFLDNQFEVVPSRKMLTGNPVKDNTGKLMYNEDSIFPTLDFPSDHGIVAVALCQK